MQENSRRIDIVLNGERRKVEARWTILDLLATLRRHPGTVAVERNGEIVRRADYGEIYLQPGDRIEVVHFVQGG